MSVDKQQTGFRFGKYKTTLISEVGRCRSDLKEYRLVYLRTSDGNFYYALRLYNLRGRFLKQVLIDPDIMPGVNSLFFDVVLDQLRVLV